MPSKKTAVIEHLFFDVKGYTEESGLPDAVVTLDEVVEAIRHVNLSLEAAGKKPLSDNNPANFWKDLTRGGLARYWPPTVFHEGFIGDDAIGMGEKACFRFVPVDEAHPEGFEAPVEPSEEAMSRILTLESLSMPLAMKALGRTDENWLAQVASRLRVIETHFAVVSGFGAVELTFLQTGIKLRRGEVDSAYSLIDQDGGQWLISLEAKGRREQIHKAQVLRAAAGFLSQASTKGLEVVGVLPMAIKVLDRSRLHVVEFTPDTGEGSDGKIVADSVFDLSPHVPGIE